MTIYYIKAGPIAFLTLVSVFVFEMLHLLHLFLNYVCAEVLLATRFDSRAATSVNRCVCVSSTCSLPTVSETVRFLSVLLVSALIVLNNRCPFVRASFRVWTSLSPKSGGSDFTSGSTFLCFNAV